MSSQQLEYYADDPPLHSAQCEDQAFDANDSPSLTSNHGFPAITGNPVSNTQNNKHQTLDLEAEYAQRPRFSGNDSTYRSFIAEEQQLYDSLKQLRSRDLSIHLFNAHSRRVRARRARDENTETEESAVNDKEVWEPPRDWATWPLESDVVPREHTEGWARLPDEERGYRKPGPGLTSRQVLEELLIIIASRRARETFDAREWESDSSRSSETDSQLEGAGAKNSAEDTDDSQDGSDESMSSSNSSVPRSRNDHLRRASGQPKPRYRSQKRVRSSDSSSVDGSASDSDESDSQVPVPMTDDFQIATLLRKPARRLLTQLDRILAGLHHARQSQLQHNDDSQTDSEQDTNDKNCETTRLTSSPNSEVKMRSRSLRRRMRSKSLSSSGSNFSSELSSDESSNDARLAASETSGKHTKSQKSRSRSISRRLSQSTRHSSRSSSSHTYKDPNRFYIPRDWSDVLGMAAVTGWDIDAVKRAQKRCEKLFEEKMEFDDVDASGQGHTMIAADLHVEGISDDELEDGVHVDGFLRHIKTRRGWRGRDSHQRVKKGGNAGKQVVVEKKRKRGRPRKRTNDSGKE